MGEEGVKNSIKLSMLFMDYYEQIDTSEHGRGRVVFKRVPNVPMEPYSVRG